MFTVIETAEFQKQASKVWGQAEHHAFIDWIAANPQSGDVVPGAGGARKVRWGVQGKGKSGGVRVIYFNLCDDELVLLVAVYAKTIKANMTAKEIRKA